MNRNTLSHSVLALAVWGLAGCGSNSSAPGPIDGYYVDASTASTCNGTTASAQQPSTFTFSGAAFTHTVTKNTNCIQTDTGTVTYAANSAITVTQTNQTCGSACAPSDCTASTASQSKTGTYSISSGTLTLTFTNSTCNNSPSNATEIEGGYVKQ